MVALQKTILFQPSELRLEKKKKNERKRRKNAVIFLPPPAIVSRSLICPPLPPPHQPPFYACLVAQAGTREVISLFLRLSEAISATAALWHCFTNRFHEISDSPLGFCFEVLFFPFPSVSYSAVRGNGGVRLCQPCSLHQASTECSFFIICPMTAAEIGG